MVVLSFPKIKRPWALRPWPFASCSLFPLRIEDEGWALFAKQPQGQFAKEQAFLDVQSVRPFRHFADLSRCIRWLRNWVATLPENGSGGKHFFCTATTVPPARELLCSVNDRILQLNHEDGAPCRGSRTQRFRENAFTPGNGLRTTAPALHFPMPFAEPAGASSCFLTDLMKRPKALSFFRLSRYDMSL
jgi:hypothetical protein